LSNKLSGASVELLKAYTGWLIAGKKSLTFSKLSGTEAGTLKKEADMNRKFSLNIIIGILVLVVGLISRVEEKGLLMA